MVLRAVGYFMVGFGAAWACGDNWALGLVIIAAVWAADAVIFASKLLGDSTTPPNQNGRVESPQITRPYYNFVIRPCFPFHHHRSSCCGKR